MYHKIKIMTMEVFIHMYIKKEPTAAVTSKEPGEAGRYLGFNNKETTKKSNENKNRANNSRLKHCINYVLRVPWPVQR